jgi:xanthine dehydrogenase/oxidase
VEGSFMMGVGFLLREEVKFDGTTGKLLTGSTWSYKPPGQRDLPAVWNVELLENTRFDLPGSLHGSKATGEPPLVLANSVIMVLRSSHHCFLRPFP